MSWPITGCLSVGARGEFTGHRNV